MLPHSSDATTGIRRPAPHGWLYNAGVGTAHFYVDGRSVCGRWLATVFDRPAMRLVRCCNECHEKRPY